MLFYVSCGLLKNIPWSRVYGQLQLLVLMKGASALVNLNPIEPFDHRRMRQDDKRTKIVNVVILIFNHQDIPHANREVHFIGKSKGLPALCQPLTCSRWNNIAHGAGFFILDQQKPADNAQEQYSQQ